MSAKPLALVIDDDAAAREALCDFLAHEDVEAKAAGDGVQGLGLVKAAPADLAFLDLKLPLLDGLSLLRMVREVQPVLPVVMMSGLPSPRDILEAMEYGAYTFITKPCDFELLERIVQEILAKDLPRRSRGVQVAIQVGSEKRRREKPTEEETGGKNMAIVRWSPFRDLLSVQQELNRLFDDLITRRAEGATEGVMWVPAVDISETDREIRAHLEVPGCKKEDIKISVANNVLTVRGEKRMEQETSGENYHRVERTYGSFVRSLELPTSVQADKVKATYNDGVLTIVLPKSEEVKSKEIPIEP